MIQVQQPQRDAASNRVRADPSRAEGEEVQDSDEAPAREIQNLGGRRGCQQLPAHAAPHHHHQAHAQTQAEEAAQAAETTETNCSQESEHSAWSQ